MPKSLLKALWLCILLAMLPSVSAQDLSGLTKQQQKEYKVTLKNLKKQGYAVFASKRSIEEALLLHFEKMAEDPNAIEIIGTASNITNKSLGHKKAVLNAQTSFLEENQASVSGSVTQSKSKDEDGGEKSLDATFGSNIEQQLQGELNETFCLVREEKEKTGDGKPLYSMMVFMIASGR